ncbi:MAG: glycosyltransferase [Burkholderiales bacterium]
MKDLFARPAGARGAPRRVLNVGGGSKGVELPPHFQGWEQLLLDIDPRVGADLVCDARALRETAEADTFEAVYCSHNLEHYYRHDVDRVLRGFLHVLKAAGYAEIRVPDIGELIKLLARNDLDIEQEIYKANIGAITAHDMIYGYAPEIEASGQDFYAHKTGFSRDSLLRALRSNGFREIYFAPPLALLELHVFAFKTAADDAQRAELGLGEPVKLEARHEATLPARRAVHGSGIEADPVEALYQRAAAAFGADRWEEAAAITEQALALEPGLPALHYLLGCCHLAQERHAAALQSFASCLALRPKYPLSAEARARQALCRARIDGASGKTAALEALAPENIQAVSVLMCSASTERSAAAAAMYHRLLAGLPHEIIVIGDARSLAEGYNRALAQARHDIVLLAHDDVEILSPDFAARLLRAIGRHDLVGVAGTRKLVGGAWHFAGHPHLAGQVGMPAAGAAGYVVNLYDLTERETKGLQALDGLLLATRRDTALRLGFDAVTFDGWHLYDLDFSLRAAEAGLDCASCNDILVVHGSQGSYDERWLEYSQRFLARHQDRLGPQQSVFFKPELVALPLRSAEEWRLLTQHLIADGG